tara:strand:- start:7907 stop:9367 length:1461 start_codon:yes stop_codon:yes gene_type:complete
MINIKYYNEAFIRLDVDAGIGYELNEFFTFVVPGAKFMPQVRNKVWDGKIRLYNVATQLLYAGLQNYVYTFAQERQYTVQLDPALSGNIYDKNDALKFIKSLNLKYVPRDYQIDAFIHAVRNNRSLLLSPTASGKSLIIYLLTQYYKGCKLIIVPTTSLVYQMQSDFIEYGYHGDCTVITASESKEWKKQINSPIVITTWQSIYKQPKTWFRDFDVVVGDEAHLFKSKSLTSIMTKLDNCKYRFGFTGTLDGTQTHKLVLEGLFGAVKKVTSSAELIDQGHLSNFKIKAIVLQYPEDIRKHVIKLTYADEMDYIVRLLSRNTFIKNLVLSLKGNTLLLFQFVDKHGKVLYNDIKKEINNTIFPRQVYYVSGDIKANDREDIRALVEEDKDAIIVASFGTFSTGINIKNLHNIIFASPTKSRIRNLQSIGRGLRKSDSKLSATLYDIADDLTYKSKHNYTIQHFAERLKTYNEEKFEYKIYTINIKV